MPERFKANIYELDEIDQDIDGEVLLPEVAMRNAYEQEREARTLQVGDSDRRLAHFEERNGLCLLNFATLRYPGPGRASRTQAIAPFQLAEDERFAYQTAMLYDPDRFLAFIQSTRPGMGVGAVAEYLERFANHVTNYRFIPRLDPEARQRAMGYQMISTVEMRVAAGQANGRDRDEGLGVMTALLGEFDARHMDVVFTVGRLRHHQLSLDRVRPFLRSALQAADEDAQVTKLKVKGRDHEDNAFEPIDLIQHREKRERVLEVDPRERNIRHEARWRALQAIHQDFVRDLE